MAKGAKFPSPGSGGLVCGVFYVCLRGPVACFTIDVLMIALAFLGHLVDVAGAANRRPSEGNVFCDFSFDRGTMMKLHIEHRGRKDDKSDRDNRRDDNGDDDGESLYLLRNLVQHQPATSRASILDQHPDLRCRLDSVLITLGPSGATLAPEMEPALELF